MLKAIHLDLDKSEFFDSYNDDEFWQRNAKNTLIDMLISTCKDAQDYRQSRLNNKNKISAAHNAICISGSRGAGKTVFLRNAKKIWEEAKLDNIEKINISNLYFAETIDPTLLNGHDNFANVIIAQLYNAVENKLSSPHIDVMKKNNFYTSLKKLAESLGKKSDFADHTGIDRILKYRSGIQVEAFFHKYVENCVELLGCQAIVVPIDDVDMALNRAVEVLDEVRRLLSCPYIIPIVSGDHELYSHMVRVHFEKNATDNKSISEETTRSGHKIGKLLADSYLTKVFPNHLRLPLLAIDRLLPHLLIKEKGISNKGISFVKYEKMLTHVFFYLCNGEERSTEYPKPESAREVTQLIKALTPLKLQEFQKHDLWNTFKSWAEQKHHGATYTNAVSISQLSDYNSEETIFRFDQLLAFNPISQVKESIPWAIKPFLSEQEIAIRDLYGKSVKKKDLSENDNVNIINSVFTHDMKILRSMPPLELYSSDMTLTIDTVKKDETNLLLAVYTHRDFYGKQGNRSYNIFFSRAFEILSVSLLSVSTNIQVANWEAQLDEIIARVPFYSIHAINPTKYLEQEGEDLTLAESVVSENINETYKTSPLALKIKDWEVASKEKLSGLNNLSILPLIHSVFNKVFTQLHILRTEISTTKKYPEEYLSDTARRFEYIVINAFASLLKDDYVIQANVAIGAQLKTLRDHKEFMRVDRTLYRNIKGMIDETVNLDTPILIEKKSSTAKPKEDIGSILLEIIWAHPIFVNLNNSKILMDEPKFQFTFYSAPPITPSIVVTSVSLNSLKEFKHILRKENINMSTKDITTWGFNNRIKALEIYNSAQKELKDTGSELKKGSEQKRMFDALKKVVGTPDLRELLRDNS
ncbi:hypothetical protein VSAL_p840_56 (plasmid) [Aliivibrio salmonicida LFI1238]|uniref:KAP NTPase domain-containing protein n=1 Tax=Aliivibrio salmonicida (strain LFI1238) TaxID=316275 RepID=B6ET27_ALISL|nr:antiviral RADAR system adenosine triphosphatase RdrA [Aliivibrio salmonicida]CAQ81915.1 hypothetical protein VSAL_p840_56 [Aliivibrio salmonicida LFI1238]